MVLATNVLISLAVGGLCHAGPPDVLGQHAPRAGRAPPSYCEPGKITGCASTPGPAITSPSAATACQRLFGYSGPHVPQMCPRGSRSPPS